METSMFVAAISGKKIYGRFSIVRIIDNLNDAHKVLDKANETLGIQFVKDEYHSVPGYYVYRNATDDRDVILTIELAYKL